MIQPARIMITLFVVAAPGLGCGQGLPDGEEPGTASYGLPGGVDSGGAAGSLPAQIRLSGSDSSVVHIEYDHPTSDPIAWLVIAPPAVQIGRVQGADWEQLHNVRDITMLPGGRLGIIDGSNRLLVYDDSGEFVREVGSPGDGPGEFRSASWVGVGDGDSIFVYDGLWGMSVFGPDFQFARRMPLPRPPDGEAHFVGQFSDGTWLVASNVSGRISSEVPDMEWGVLAFGVADKNGGYRDVEGRWRFSLRRIGGGGRLVYPPYAEAAPWGLDIAYSRGDLRQIEVIDRNGDVIRTTLIRSPARPVPPEMRAAFVPPENPITRARMGEIRIADVMPWHNTANAPGGGKALITGPTGIWVQRYAWPSESALVWDVFDEVGRYEGVARVPAGFHVMEVLDTRVLGVWRDSLGVEYVQMLELVRP